jgi:hypothetical protein
MKTIIAFVEDTKLVIDFGYLSGLSEIIIKY